MIRELKIAVSASGKEAQYDEHAKNIAGQKFIIANILAKSVEAFRGMKPKDIIPYIEGEPYISKVPVEPGHTNAAREENGQRVVGLNTENQEIHVLGAVFSKKLTLEEKLNILQEYDVPVEEEFRKDVNEMCNLGEGILEDGIAIGLQKGQAELIRNMHKNGLTAEQIAAVTDKNIEEVKDILENKNSEK